MGPLVTKVLHGFSDMHWSRCPQHQEGRPESQGTVEVFQAGENIDCGGKDGIGQRNIENGKSREFCSETVRVREGGCSLGFKGEDNSPHGDRDYKERKRRWAVMERGLGATWLLGAVAGSLTGCLCERAQRWI